MLELAAVLIGGFTAMCLFFLVGGLIADRIEEVSDNAHREIHQRAGNCGVKGI